MDDPHKKLGQVFTPRWVVDIILDRVGYNGVGILERSVFEPGCGNGAFLVAIVERFIGVARGQGLNGDAIKQKLEKCIYGVEVDADVYADCITRLNALSEKHHLPSVDWRIDNADILDLPSGNSPPASTQPPIQSVPKFDYVVGNPPYVRIHNLDKERVDEIKSRFRFCRNGIIDLFLVFFEIGILALNKNGGKLGFITPNSFIHNATYVNFRQYLVDHRLLRELIDFKDAVVFDDASTYNAITILDTEHNRASVAYYEYMDGAITHVNDIDLTRQESKKWNFTNRQNMAFLDEVNASEGKIADYAVVQYGFATLLDKAFIIKSDAGFRATDREHELLFPVVKGSRYDGGRVLDKIIYPYRFGRDVWSPIPENELQENFPNIYAHLVAHKNALEKRDADSSARYWYEYGRSQGIQTMHHEKLVISPIFKDRMKVYKVARETMVYSGIYLFFKDDAKQCLDEVAEILGGAAFLRYARIVGKDMRGGYKTINTKAIKKFAARL